MKKYIMLVAFATGSLCASAQYWNDTGNPSVIPGTNFLGSINSAPLDFRTENVQRMRLLPTLTGQTVGTFTNENLSGNLGIGAFTSSIVNRPFSLLHLDNGGTQYSGYRPWFRPGMTITNGSDMAWIGLKNEGGDINHLTLAWADNALQDGPGHMGLTEVAPSYQLILEKSCLVLYFHRQSIMHLSNTYPSTA